MTSRGRAKRRRRAQEAGQGARREGAVREERGPAAVEGERRRPLAGILGDAAIVLGPFAVVSALAAALGAANFGTALAFGQLGFALALAYVLTRRR
jgi:hypothetical protein